MLLRLRKHAYLALLCFMLFNVVIGGVQPFNTSNNPESSPPTAFLGQKYLENESIRVFIEYLSLSTLPELLLEITQGGGISYPDLIM